MRDIGLLFRSLWRLIRGQDQRARKVRWMLGLLRPYRGRLMLMFAALLLETAAGLAPPYLAGHAIDAGIKTGDVGALDLTVAAFVAAALLYAAGTYAETYLVGWVGTRALQDLRERIFTHLQAMSIGFFTRRSPGVLISRMTNDVEALNQLVTSGVVTMFNSVLTLVGVVVILLLLDLKLALITFLTFPLLAIASVVFRIISAGAYRATRERIAAITGYLQETLSGVRVVRSFGQEPRHAEAMTELNEANREANMKTVYLNASYFPAVELLAAVGTAVILLYGGSQAIDGAIQIGVIVAFVGYLATFFEPIQELSQLYTTYQQGMAALDKIFDLLDTPPDMVDAPDAIDPGSYAARSRWRGSPSPTRTRTGHSRTSTYTSPRARPWPWSGRPERASRPSPSSSPASTIRRRDGCWSTATTCEASSSGPCGASSGSCRRRASSSPAACARTSPSAGPRQTWRRSKPLPQRWGRRSSSVGCRRGSRPRSASAASSSRRGSASSSPSPAPCWPSRES